MKVTLERAALLKSLGHVHRVVERRNTIPILSNVLIGAADGALQPVGTVNPVQYLDWPAEMERVQAAGAVALRLLPDVQRSTVHALAKPSSQYTS